jgi:hypothetical protein
MYVHFQDWSEARLLQSLDERRLPHGDRIIKVMTSEVDPRVALGRSALTVVESGGGVFDADETFAYAQRRTYSGDELEEGLAKYGLGEVGQRTVRGLFRFSHNAGFCQAAMMAKKPIPSRNEWLIRHPFEHMDGIEAAQRLPAREGLIHLDIFFPRSLEDLRRVVDYDDETALVGSMEWIRWFRKQV